MQSGEKKTIVVCKVERKKQLLNAKLKVTNERWTCGLRL
jgi:hypothetical protein